MSDALAEAKARALAVAAKLNSLPGIGGSSVLGKRFRDGEATEKKIYVPLKDFPDINYRGILIGPKGKHQKELEERTGASVLVRGRGTERPGDPPEEDEMHVVLRGPPESVEKATKEVEAILFNPEEAMRIKRGQLSALKGDESAMGGKTTSGGHYGPSNGGFEGNSGRMGLGFHGGMSRGMADGPVVHGPTDHMQVPDTHVGMIIGRGGAHVRQILQEFGVRLSVPRDPDPSTPGFRTIDLTGPEPSIEAAKKRIENMINGQNQHGGGHSSSASDVVAVPVDRVGKLIGRGGATISQLQQTFSCRIQIPSEPDPSNPSTKSVHISANSKEQIELVKEEITKIISHEANMGGGQPYGGGGIAGSVNVTYDIPDERVGAVIGKRGATIQYIQNTSGTRIQIPNDADPTTNPRMRHAVISGLPQNCERAKQEIENILANDGRIPTNSSSGSDPYGGSSSQSGYGQYGGYDASNPYADPNNPNAYMYAAYNPYAIAAAAASQSQMQQPGAAGQTQETANVDMSYYHQQFWQYAAYYGEEYARAAYGAWAPPVGTPCPPGITLPTQAATPAQAADAVTSQSTAAGTSEPSTAAPTQHMYATNYAAVGGGESAAPHVGVPQPTTTADPYGIPVQDPSSYAAVYGGNVQPAGVEGVASAPSAPGEDRQAIDEASAASTGVQTDATVAAHVSAHSDNGNGNAAPTVSEAASYQ